MIRRIAIPLVLLLSGVVIVPQGVNIALGVTHIGGTVSSGAVTCTLGYALLVLGTYASVRYCTTKNWANVFVVVVALLFSGTAVAFLWPDAGGQALSLAQRIALLSIALGALALTIALRSGWKVRTHDMAP